MVDGEWGMGESALNYDDFETVQHPGNRSKQCIVHRARVYIVQIPTKDQVIAQFLQRCTSDVVKPGFVS
jgi:hypothetical protein